MPVDGSEVHGVDHDSAAIELLPPRQQFRDTNDADASAPTGKLVSAFEALRALVMALALGAFLELFFRRSCADWFVCGAGSDLG